MTLPPAFPAPQTAASLYEGVVMHARMKPKPHRFTYNVFNLLIDIDQLGAANRLSALFSIGRFNLLSFHERDHAAGTGALRPQVDALLAQAGIDTPARRIVLLCYPRVLGFVFNPISVYFAYDAEDRPLATVYEVRNTFGEMHSYVCPIEPGQLTAAGIRQERDKRLYVSPFLDMPLRYLFRLRPPGDEVAVRILETDREGPILAATFHGDRKDLKTFAILFACARVPFMTLKVVAGIHWEALKLWLKGIRLHTRPAPPAPSSFMDRDPEPSPAGRTMQ